MNSHLQSIIEKYEVAIKQLDDFQNTLIRINKDVDNMNKKIYDEWKRVAPSYLQHFLK